MHKMSINYASLLLNWTKAGKISSLNPQLKGLIRVAVHISQAVALLQISLSDINVTKKEQNLWNVKLYFARACSWLI